PGLLFNLLRRRFRLRRQGRLACRLYDLPDAAALRNSASPTPGRLFRHRRSLVDWRGSAVLAGTQDGEILEIGTEQLDRPAVLVQSHSEGELWALAPHPKKPVLCASGTPATGDCQQKARLDRKARSCAFNEDGSLIACGFIDGGFTVFRTRDLVELFSAKERKEVLHEMKFSPDGKFLAVGVKRQFRGHLRRAAKVKEKWFERPRLRLSSGAPGQACLATAVKGIWEKYTDTNDVNAVDVNFEHEVIIFANYKPLYEAYEAMRCLATGDDFGLVKLLSAIHQLGRARNFRPLRWPFRPRDNVRWLQDGCTLVSIGGADHAVFSGASEGGDDVAGVGALTDGVGQSSAYLDSGSEGSDTDSSAAGGWTPMWKLRSRPNCRQARNGSELRTTG
uniref:WD_REPEATS_REGION domain-containing protein n=1 Tax=Macrostomum lignano TaxID=282301 RepID=A0A1I8FJQ8_9PLAT